MRLGPKLCDSLDMLPTMTREAARRFGDATAYITEAGWPITYSDIDRISDEVAAGLLHRGVGEGDVVALVLPPGSEYLLAYLGAAKVGAITTGVNDRLEPSERQVVLKQAVPRLVIAGQGLAPANAGLASGNDIGLVETGVADSLDRVLPELRDAGDEVAQLPDDPNRPVAIIYTSGTTGCPKGALYTNRQLAFITHTDVGDAWGGGTCGMSGTSFAHLGFMTKLAGNMKRGSTTFILGKWRAEQALQLVERERLAVVAGVPTQLALMLRHADFDRINVESVNYLIVGGGPITPGLAEEARQRFGAALATRYSCTEAGIGLGTAFDDPHEDAVLSVGRPLPSVALAVLDADDQPVAQGDVGAVCLRSPAVMSAYWRDPEGTQAAFTADGHVRTGDLGWVDDLGRLRLVGRSKEMYVRGGYNVYPVEVEAVCSDHPLVAAIAVVPRADDVMGEVGVAVVVARAGSRAPTLEELREFASERLAKYKLPGELVVVDALPLTPGDKIDRKALLGVLGTFEAR